ncbi:MAG: hypothetical protein ACK56F_30425, partial [bacterium]
LSTLRVNFFLWYTGMRKNPLEAQTDLSTNFYFSSKRCTSIFEKSIISTNLTFIYYTLEMGNLRSHALCDPGTDFQL